MSEQRKRPTLEDVAKLAGVDKAVISRVANADPKLRIKDETRERVLAAIGELGYVPNTLARSLRTSNARTVGLIIPDFANPVYAEIIGGAERATREAGNHLMVASADLGESSLDRVIDWDRIDGLLIAGGGADSAALARLTGQGKPWLLVNHRAPGVARWVVVDDVAAARLATEHLLELGHTRIAHIGGPLGSDTAERRLRGFTEAMNAAGVPVDPALVLRAPYDPGGGFQAGEQLVTMHPTAVLVANVTAAFGAIDALTRARLRIPDDVSLVAVHDHALAEHTIPRLTTVRLPLRELGARAVALLQLGANDPVDETFGAAPELIVRGSTAAI